MTTFKDRILKLTSEHRDLRGYTNEEALSIITEITELKMMSVTDLYNFSDYAWEVTSRMERTADKLGVEDKVNMWWDYKERLTGAVTAELKRRGVER